MVSITSSGLQTNLSVHPWETKDTVTSGTSMGTRGGKGVTGGGACYLDVGDSVFVLVHRQVGLGYWKKGGKRTRQIYETKPSLSG